MTLYRKWRPQTFSEVRGQERVVRTLQNALAAGRIGHAYLFCGPRGVGKTTTARLLAKALNCLHDDGAGERAGLATAQLPQPYAPGEPIPAEPDNTCWVCREISAGSSLDVIEVDAASNGRVDDARELRGAISSGANTSRYKFYILDEAHQMTKDAFDALLKTFEEPPPRVVFVLATTDAGKLPPTVLSRCQRFDFRRISVADIRASLIDICAAEGIEAEPAALEVLARAADGSSRDSQSLLDQAIAFSGSAITLAGVRSMLGLASADTIDRLAAALLAGDARSGLELVNEATDAGVDPRGLNRELVEHLRCLLLLKVSSDTAASLDVAPEALPALRAQAVELSAAVLVRQIKIFSEADYGFRSALQAQLPLELAFLQAIDAGQGAAPSPAAAAAPSPAPSAALRTGAAGEGLGEETSSRVANHPHPNPLPPAAEGIPVTGHDARPPASAAEKMGAHAAAESKAEWKGPTIDDQESAVALSLPAIVDNWPAVLQAVGAHSKNVQALLRDCTPTALDGSTLTLACPDFHARELQKPENKRMVEGAVGRAAGGPCYVKCVVRDRKADATKALPSGQPEAAKPDDDDPLVRAALRMLNARVLESN